MKRVFRYTVIAAIACVMVLTVRIATQELNMGMEGQYKDYSLDGIAHITSEPTFTPINYERPTFGMGDSSPLDSLPDNSSPEQQTGQEQPNDNETDSNSTESSGTKSQSSSKTGNGSSGNSAASKPSGSSGNNSGSSGNSGSNNTSSGNTSVGGNAQGETPKETAGGNQPSTEESTKDNSKYAWYIKEAPRGYEPYMDGDFYLICYPENWSLNTGGGEYGSLVFESAADADGDKTTMTLVSAQLDTEEGLSVFAQSGNAVVNEAISNAGVNAAIVDKGYATTGARQSYYIIIDVPNGNKTNQLSQYYIFHKDKVLLVEFSGVKGKVSEEHIKKVLGSFNTK